MSWWMTGRRDSLHFYVLFRSSLRGVIKLQKMAGDLLDCLVLVVRPNRCLAFMHRCTCHGSGVVEREHVVRSDASRGWSARTDQPCLPYCRCLCFCF